MKAGSGHKSIVPGGLLHYGALGNESVVGQLIELHLRINCHRVKQRREPEIIRGHIVPDEGNNSSLVEAVTTGLSPSEDGPEAVSHLDGLKIVSSQYWRGRETQYGSDTKHCQSPFIYSENCCRIGHRSQGKLDPNLVPMPGLPPVAGTGACVFVFRVATEAAR